MRGQLFVLVGDNVSTIHEPSIKEQMDAVDKMVRQELRLFLIKLGVRSARIAHEGQVLVSDGTGFQWVNWTDV